MCKLSGFPLKPRHHDGVYVEMMRTLEDDVCHEGLLDTEAPSSVVHCQNKANTVCAQTPPYGGSLFV